MVAFILGEHGGCFRFEQAFTNCLLGFGIGVLIRMLWALGVVVIRSFKGTKEEPEMVDSDGTYYEGVVLFNKTEHDSPPEYIAPTSDMTFPDEKKATPTADNTL